MSTERIMLDATPSKAKIENLKSLGFRPKQLAKLLGYNGFAPQIRGEQITAENAQKIEALCARVHTGEITIYDGMLANQSYRHTETTDGVIREAYRLYREYSNTRAIPAACKKLGWPKHAVSQRARRLGLAKTKERPWTDAEEQVLEKHSGLSLGTITRKMREAGYKRSETAIHLKMKRLKVRSTPNYWTTTALGSAFGVDVHKVSAWMRQGFLKFTAKGTRRVPEQGGDSLVASRDDVRRFILNHPDEIDLGKVEKFWFLDIVSGGKLCEEFRREAA
jgi:hypothetical protein